MVVQVSRNTESSKIDEEFTCSSITFHYNSKFYGVLSPNKLRPHVSGHKNCSFSVSQRRLGDAAKKAIGKLTTRTVKKGDKVRSSRDLLHTSTPQFQFWCRFVRRPKKCPPPSADSAPLSYERGCWCEATWPRPCLCRPVVCAGLWWTRGL